jgi:hypothetical protein
MLLPKLFFFMLAEFIFLNFGILPPRPFSALLTNVPWQGYDFDRTKLLNRAKERRPWDRTAAEKERARW